MKLSTLLSAIILTGSILVSLSASANAKEHSEHRGEFLLSKRAVAALDLTVDQQAQIKSIIEGLKADKKERKLERKENREAFRALVEAENFDEDKAKALMSDIKTERSEKMLAHLKSRHQIWQLLTVEQREKLTEMREKRKDKQRRHRD
jgi:protein CpxP